MEKTKDIWLNCRNQDGVFMFFIVLLFSNLANAQIPWDQAQAKCQEQIRWGYFQQKLVDGLGASDLWAIKDLHGKFKTKEECENDQARYKKKEMWKRCRPDWKECRKGLPEDCESFTIKTVLGFTYKSMQGDRERFFSTEEKCKAEVEKSGGSMAPCEKLKFEACKAMEAPINYDNLE